MSQYQYAATELQTLLRDFFGHSWKVVVAQRPKNSVWIETWDGRRVEAKHVVRLLEILPEALGELDPWDLAAVKEERDELDNVLTEKNEEIARLERQVDEANDAALKLEREIDDLNEELSLQRLKIHVSNQDED